jgi:hypothetical protein
MNLFLIENDKSVHLLRTYGEYSKGRDIILCFNYLPYLTFQKLNDGDAFFFVEELLNTEDYEKLHSAMDEFALAWYKINGTDATLFDDISYGEITNGMFSRTYMLSVLVKYGEIIRKAFVKWHSIANVYYDFSNNYNSFFIYEDDNGRFFNKRLLVEIVCKQLHLTCHQVDASICIPSAHVGNIFSTQGHKSIKKKVFDCFNRIQSWTQYYVLSSVTARRKTYLHTYFNINKIIQHINGKFILSSYPGIKYLLMHPLGYLRLSDVPYRLSNKERVFLEILRQRDMSDSSYLGTDFVHNGICYYDIYKTAIRDLVLNVIPILIAFAGRTRKAVVKCNIKKILILEEIQEMIRVLIGVCRREGVQIIFLDHGIQGHNHAQKVFDRDKSDVVICAGPFYVQHYQSLNSENRKCVVLGNPITDYCHPRKRKTISSIKNILFLTFEDNFYARLDRFPYQEKYYEEIFSTFNDLLDMGIKIFYKPHFENRLYHEYLFKYFEVNTACLNYIDEMPFSELIYEMDLMVCNVSTCFYEAQAAGVPTIFMEPCFIKDSLLPPLNGTNGVDVLRVSSGSELLEIVKTNQNDPDYLKSFLGNFMKNHAPLYMGQLDGMAGKRIIDFLSKK